MTEFKHFVYSSIFFREGWRGLPTSELFGECVKIPNPGPYPRAIDSESLELRSHEVWGIFIQKILENHYFRVSSSSTQKGMSLFTNTKK